MAPAYPLRFFRVVTTLPPLIIWTFGVIAVIGAAAIMRDAARSEGAMVPVLLLQLFAASSGFEVPARRGHYDLLLTSGHGRVWMALVHWASSIAPGVLSWLVLAAVEAITGAGTAARLLASGTVAAVVLVSTLPWAITVRLPRFSGGIGWLLALAISTTVWPSIEPSNDHLSEADALLASAWAFLIYPARLVGRELQRDDVLIAAPALVLAVCSMAVACRWVSKASVPLEAAQ
jgi:hypothetical protein